MRLNRLAIAAFGLMAGCVHVEQDLVIKPDGSGEVSILYGVKDEDVQRMRQVAEQMAAIDPSLAKSDVDWLTAFDEAAIRKEWSKHATPGVSLHQVRTELVDGWRFMRANIRFDSLQSLLDCGMIENCHMALSRGPDGQYGFQQSLDLRKRMKYMPEGFDASSFQPLASMLMQDFEATFRVHVPGKIIRSNADRTEGQRAIWEITGEDPDAVSRLQQLDLRVLFDGRNLKIADARMRP